ncbi:hypothetical protein MMC07_001773 [Pseudocyphellaria aurata]|nr:hypothetical protein [Pseudocyphellaria aurata]
MSALLDIHAEAPPQRPKSPWEEKKEQAQYTFNKTIDGHYRHGSTGYARVACLFLTWKDDDLQCKETEVDMLRDIFAKDFHFETDYFEIPSEKWSTALQLKIANFIHEYNSPDCMVVIYYGGHGYEGIETKKLKLSAKIEADGDGDPNVFFNDILHCLRPATCDQLLIVDCCYAAKAFRRKHVSERKFELLTSAGVVNVVPVPTMNGSFTKHLNRVLKSLLSSEPQGFTTFRLYREVFHSLLPTAEEVKKNKIATPYLFDLARRDLGKIWLRPQKETTAPRNKEQSVHLKLSLQLHKQPDNALMNELAIALQYLPHVDKVEYQDLFAPEREMKSFMRSVMQAQKLRPLIRELIARRKQKEIKKTDPPPIKRMLLEQNHQPLYDWSGEFNHDGQGPTPSGDHRNGSIPWPIKKQEHTVTTRSIYNPFFSIDLRVDLPGKGIMSRLCSWWTNTDAGSTHASDSATGSGVSPSDPTPDRITPASGLVAIGPSKKHSWRSHLSGEETWDMLKLMAMLFVWVVFAFLCFVGE